VIACPCDYTHSAPGGCGTSPVAGCTCPRQEELCGAGTSPWSDLTSGGGKVPFSVTAAGQVYLYRYFHNEKCKAVRIKLDNMYGHPMMYISTTDPVNSAADAYIRDGVRVNVNDDYTFSTTLCPNQWIGGGYTYGTIFITIVADFAADAIGNLSLTLYDVPSAPVTTVPCTVASAGIPCMQDGEIIPINVPAELAYVPITYSFTFSGCKQLSILQHVVGGESDLIISETPFYGSTNEFLATFTGGGNQTWLSSRYTDDWTTLSLCAPEGKTIYLTTLPYGAVYLELSVSTNAEIILLPFAQLDPNRVFGDLSGTSQIRPDTPGAQPLQCLDQWYVCFGIYAIQPSNNPDPIWPIPFLVGFGHTNRQRFLGLKVTNYTNEPIANKYALAVILNYDVDSQKGGYITASELIKSKIEFLGNIVNKDLEPLLGSYSLTQRVRPACSTEALKSVMKVISTNIDLLNNPAADQNELQFEIDRQTVQNTWLDCLAQVQQYLDVTTQPVEKMTTACVAAVGSDEFKADPCCDPYVGWVECCAPRMKNVTATLYDARNNNNLVNAQCQHPDCTSSYLSDLSTVLTNSEACDVPAKELTKYQDGVYSIFRQCRISIYETPALCSSNADCGAGATCNLLSHTCIVPSSSQESAYFDCVYDQLSLGILSALKIALNLPATTLPADLKATFATRVRTTDCVASSGLNLGLRTTHAFWWPAGCFTSGWLNTGPQLCPDRSCDPGPTSFLTACGNLRSWVDYPSSEATCLAAKNCNYGGCDGLNSTACEDKCNAAPASFCGVCLNDKTCVEVPSADCTTGGACILPDSTITTTLDASTCAAQISCTHSCGHTCASATYPSGLCAANNNGSSVNCTDNGGNIVGEYCVYAVTDAVACTAKDAVAVFSTCPTSLPGCGVCMNGDPSCTVISVQSLLQCAFVEKPCATAAECANAGQCSDHTLTMQLDPLVGPVRYGVCVTPIAVGFPGCNAPIEFSPMGCYDPSSLTPAGCEAVGGVWWLPATSQTECLSHMGCNELDINPAAESTFIHTYSPKNQDKCNLCSENYQSYFSWTSAKTTTGNYLSLQTIPKNFGSLYTWSDTLDFTAFQTSVLNAANAHLVLLAKSGATCRFERLSAPLTSVTCDCTGQANCFVANAAVPASAGQVCNGESPVIQSSISSLTFAATSVASDCESVQVSEISRESFRGVPPQRLSSNFIGLNEFTFYAVKNDKGAVVGQIVSDGVLISVGSGNVVTDVIVCLKASINSNYPVLDFGSSDSDFTNVKPLNIPVTYSNGQLCATIPSIKVSKNLFGVIHIANWEAEPKRSMSSTNAALAYTLGALFTVATLLALIEFGFAAYRNRKSIFRVPVIYSFAFYAFTQIRMIYFFLIPSNTFESSAVTDYVLVVLPMFLYFTAFSTIVVSWALSINSGRTSPKKAMRVIAIINVILYLFFIAICLIFQYTVDRSESVCPGRQDLVSNTRTQTAISVAYAVIISVLSLVLAVAFIVYGYRIVSTFNVAQLTTNSTAKLQKKIFNMTVLASAVFLVHCIYILILTGGQISNAAFSFVLLVLTEVLPVIILAFTYFSTATLVSKGSIASLAASSSAQSASGTSSTSMGSVASTKEVTVSGASSSDSS